MRLVSTKGYARDVRNDPGRSERGRTIGMALVHDPSRRHRDPVEVAVIRRELDRGGAAKNVKDVIEAAKVPIAIEVVGLLSARGGNVLREAHRQPPPDLAALGPRLDLARNKSRTGQ